MKKSFKNLNKELDDFFQSPPDLNQKAWSVINQFYHIVLTFMEDNNITQAELSKKMRISRSAVSQLFSKTPNISVKKMVEIADSIGINIEIYSPDIELSKQNIKAEYNYESVINYLGKNWVMINLEEFQNESYMNFINLEENKFNEITIPIENSSKYSELFIN